MNRKILVALLATILVTPVVAGLQVMEARGLVKQFGSNLKGERSCYGSKKNGGGALATVAAQTGQGKTKE